MNERSRSASRRRFTEVIYLRTTPAEKQRIAALARNANLSESRYLVRLAMDGKPPPSEQDRQRLTELLYLFRRVSTHLSRLLDCRNTLRRAGAEDSLLAELEQAAEFIEAVTREVRRRI